MDVVELVYKEFCWEERIDDAGGKPRKKEKGKRCRYGSMGVISFIIGVFLTYGVIKILIF